MDPLGGLGQHTASGFLSVGMVLDPRNHQQIHAQAKTLCCGTERMGDSVGCKDITLAMENQLAENVEHEIETGLVQESIGDTKSRT